MGMSAHDHIDASRLCRQACIAYIFSRFSVGAKVTETNDHIAILCPQDVRHHLCHRVRVKIARRFKILRCDQAFGVAAQAEHAYFQATFMQDDIGLDDVRQGRAAEIIVGTDDGEVGLPQHRRQGVQAVVELMIPQGGGIITHSVHGLYLHAPVIEIEIGRALTEIAGVQQQQMTVLLPLLLDEAHTTGITAGVVCLRLHLRVRVVRVQNSQMVLRRASDKAKKNKFTGLNP